MANEPYQQGTDPPAVPPTTPGPLPQMVPVSKWPKVLGVIAIVLGVLGALGAAWGAIATAVMPAVMRSAPPQVSAQMESMKQMRGWMIATSALGLPVAVLLLVAGIGLCKRRRWGVTTARTWAVLKMLLVLFTSAATSAMMWGVQGASFSSGPTPVGGGAFIHTVQVTSLVFGLIFGLAWGWALPVFMLIWLSRAKIKAETTTWQ